MLWNFNNDLPIGSPHFAPVSRRWLSMKVHLSLQFLGAGKLSVILLPLVVG